MLRSAAATPNPTIEGSHNGYRRLRGRNEHKRRWVLDARSLRIEDYISGTFRSAEARFHTPPGVEVHKSGGHEVSIRWSEHGSARLMFDGAAAVEVVDDTWHPRFGESQPSRCVSARFAGPTLRTWLCWEAAV